MEQSLKKILNWVKENSPQTLEHLNGSAEPVDIETVETNTGLTLPASFKEFLKIHDGEDGESWLALLGNGNQLLPCRAIIEQYKLEQEIGRQLYDPAMETLEFWKERISCDVIAVKGAVKPLILHPRWLPFTCMNGNVMRYFDFDPAPGGIPGQVIEVEPEGCSYQVIAVSFEQLLEIYAGQLEKGLYHVTSDGFIESEAEENCFNWGVPDWLI